MAVYTTITRHSLDCFLEQYELGRVVAFTPIAEGIENTNYLLVTEAGRFILTLFEARMNPADLPFHVSLMKYLATRGIVCPLPVADRSGAAIRTLCSRPALVTTYLEGRSPELITSRHCRALGEACASLHSAGMDFPMRRSNDLSVARWRSLFETTASRADNLRPGMSARLRKEIDEIERLWPADLPSGVIHADLFPDNVFFVGQRLTGLIDFYFACCDLLTYDLAICMNAWCFGGRTEPDPVLATALIEGYESLRPLQSDEREALPILARGAALRFMLTRLEDWFKSSDNGFSQRKDPLELLPVIDFYREHGDLWLRSVNWLKRA